MKDSNQEIPSWFNELIRFKYDKEERYGQQNRAGKAYHHKWRGGGFRGGRGGYGGNRNFYRGRDEEDVGYDSDYSRPRTYGGNTGYNDNFGYE